MGRTTRWGKALVAAAALRTTAGPTAAGPKRRVRAVLAAAVAALPVLVAAPAQAAPAQVTQNSGCYSNPFFGITTCYSTASVLASEQTASGNIIVAMNGRSSQTITRTATGEEIASTGTRTHHSSLIRDGETQVLTLKSISESEVGTSTCVTSMHVHYANGELRVNEPSDTICSWE